MYCTTLGRALAAGGFLAALAGAASADVLPTEFDFSVSLLQAGTMERLAPHPNVVIFTGLAQTGYSSDPTPDGTVVTNPLYQGSGHEGQNPLFRGGGSAPADPHDPWPEFQPEFFSAFSAALTFDRFISSNGVIHRDLAARNILLRTSLGDFSTLPGSVVLLGSDGPADLTRPGDPPIRWSPPEVLRLYLNGDASTGAFFEATLTFETRVVPTPSAIGALGLAGMVALRRRR